MVSYTEERLKGKFVNRLLLKIAGKAVQVLRFSCLILHVLLKIKDGACDLNIFEKLTCGCFAGIEAYVFYQALLFILTGKELTENEVKEHAVHETRSNQSNVRYKRGVLGRGTQHHVMDQHPHLIQRMESGYESSERNSNSPVSLDMPLSESSSTHRYISIKFMFGMIEVLIFFL